MLPYPSQAGFGLVNQIVFLSRSLGTGLERQPMCGSVPSPLINMVVTGVRSLIPNATIISEPENLRGLDLYEYYASRKWTLDEVRLLQDLHLRSGKTGFCDMRSIVDRPHSIGDSYRALLSYPVPLEKRITHEQILSREPIDSTPATGRQSAAVQSIISFII